MNLPPDLPPEQPGEQLALIAQPQSTPVASPVEIDDPAEYAAGVDEVLDELEPTDTITTDDIRRLVGLPTVRNWAGLTVARAAKRGALREIGFGRSVARSRHGGTVRLWQVVGADPEDCSCNLTPAASA